MADEPVVIWDNVPDSFYASVHADYQISGTDLDPATVTDALRIQPTMVRLQGEQCYDVDEQGKKRLKSGRYLSGIWRVSTKRIVDRDLPPQEHLDYIAELLRPHVSTLQALISQHDLFARTWMRVMGDSSGFVAYSIKPETLSTLVSVSSEIRIVTICPPDDQEEERPEGQASND